MAVYWHQWPGSLSHVARNNGDSVLLPDCYCHECHDHNFSWTAGAFLILWEGHKENKSPKRKCQKCWIRSIWWWIPQNAILIDGWNWPTSNYFEYHHHFEAFMKQYVDLNSTLRRPFWHILFHVTWTRNYLESSFCFVAFGPWIYLCLKLKIQAV